MSLSLLAVPVNAKSIRAKFRSKQIPRIVLIKHVDCLRSHEAFPHEMTMNVIYKDMMCRKVGDTYEYGWLLGYKGTPMFMACHETKTGDFNVLRNGMCLEQDTVHTTIQYCMNDTLISPDIMEYIDTYSA